MMTEQGMFAQFEALAAATLAACKTEVTLTLQGKPQQLSLYLPGGDEKYPAFWTRDAYMMACSGLVPQQAVEGWIELLCLCGQNGPETLRLEHGLMVPPWAVADHVSLEGRPTWFPGSYATGTDQGCGAHGVLPPLDDQYYLILMVADYCKASSSTSILNHSFEGHTLYRRMKRAFDAYNVDAATMLCYSDEEQFAVDWGFCDCIHKTGYLLFPSLLRYAAAGCMADLARATDNDDALYFSEVCETLRQSIPNVFWAGDGWLLSATGACAQRDVWGTAYGLWMDILPSARADESAEALLNAYWCGQAAQHGSIRHILPGDDHSDETAWERAMSAAPYNRYQNGGYWPVPLGWYAWGMARACPKAARHLCTDYLRDTYQNRYLGAPFEWSNRDNTEYSGRQYGASVSLPLQGMRRLGFVR